MKNEDKKQDLIIEYSNKIQSLIHELENKIEDNIKSCEIYWGDLIINGEEKEGTKVILSTISGVEEVEDLNETNMTAQDIVRQYHATELTLKNLMSDSLGLPHITDKYLVLIEEEKMECRKALGEDNEEYFKLL